MQPTPSASGERWNVNMPAVIGVVLVFLVGVVIWVIVSAGDDEPAADDAGATSAVTTDTSTGATGTSAAPPATPPPSLSPTPLPTTTSPTSSAPTSDPTTTEPTPTTEPPPVTTAPGADDDAVPGDLAVPGVPMARPPCDGGYITVLASPIGDQATGPGVGAVLEQYPGSHYLRTDQTCSSLNPESNGEPIYVIFFGPFAFDTDACAARADGPEGAYVRQLSDEIGPDHSVACA